MRKTLSLGLLPALALCAVASARAAEYWVGADDACDFQSIQPAIEAARRTPEQDTIRIAKNGAYANQSLEISTPVKLIGGYSDCGATTRDGHTVLTGNQKEAVLRISRGDPVLSEFHVEGLDISNGGNDPSLPTSGGIGIFGKVRVRLSDSVVRNNVGGRAGTGRPHGGGVTVYGASAELVIERGVDIRDNNASGNGGGILVDGGRLRIRPHGVTIRQNSALVVGGSGGGIAVINGGLTEITTSPEDPTTPVDGVLVDQNRATECGGGIYVGGLNSQLFASNLVAIHNTAVHGRGGGLCVEKQGYARLDAQPEAIPSRHCPPGLECLSLSHNRAYVNGAALYVADDGSVHLDGVAIRRNELLLDTASAIRFGNAIGLTGNASVLHMVNSLVADNACAAANPNCVTLKTYGGHLYLAHVTFARNGNESGALIDYDARSNLENILDAHLYSNLVADKEHFYASERSTPPIPEATIRSQCTLKNRGRPRGGETVAPITFLDAAAGNYRLAPGNLAIDYCDGDGAAPWSRNPDLDRQPRGIDDPDHFNRGGLDTNTYDLGAYEFRAAYDRLFADGFDATP